ncbi:hypothetical protein CIL03_11340 [Virgibacillus indicus]|uniref:Polysaccharide pyruvyl transferase domain-containing protein n=1 Tax=Virgibacillus indicus TaxID=2024554 RepID=A0A265N8V4_9BACI|nr:polysaccharide pyruvyl transferase family protein [Virgibacillus indicus]OZU88241.1 hypothetical protein CIL03_11340 [Virgibacillus indicus]
MKIVFVSFIDSTNLGDLLIADILEEKLMNEHSVTKYSFNFVPDRFVIRRDTEIKRTRKKMKLKNFYNEYFRKIGIIDKLHSLRVIRNIEKNKYLTEFEESVKKCDFLVVGGGNAIFDLTRHSLSSYKFKKILSIAKKYNKKSLITSIGIGPFITKKQLEYTINSLKDANFITVRDQKSFNYIKPSLMEKVHLSIDPVFLLEKSSEVKGQRLEGKKVISLCILDLSQNKDSVKKYNKYLQDLVEIILYLSEENYKVNLFSTEPRDYNAVYDVYEKVNAKSNVSVVNITNFKELIDLYSVTDLVIGTRMHSMIIALSQFIPVIGLSWQDKVKEMFQMINSPEDVIDIDDIENNMDTIKKLVSNKIKNKHHITDNLVKLKNINRKKFEINNQLFNELEIGIMKTKDSINGE